MAAPRTKIEKILQERRLNQTEFRNLIFEKTGINMPSYQVSKIVSGKTKDYYLRTAAPIARTLGLKIDDIIEDEVLNYSNL